MPKETCSQFGQSEFYRFSYNPEVRLTRYGLMAMGFVVCLLTMLLREDSLSVYLVLAMVGFFLLAIVVTELYLLTAKGRAIEIDKVRREIRLERFVYPLAFFDIKPKGHVVIPFESLRGIEHIQSRKSPWRSYIVHTTKSKFAFNDYFSETDQLIALLEEIAKDTDPIHPARRMMVLYFTAGIFGLLVVALLGWLIGWI